MTITPEHAAAIVETLSPGQQRTAAARAARARQANEKAAARLRAAGYVVLPAASLTTMAESVARSGQADTDWGRGFGDGLKSVAEVAEHAAALDAR